jgi:hypothetical protein
LLVVVVHSKLRDAAPEGFTDVTQVIVATKNGRLLIAATFERSKAASERTVHLEEFFGPVIGIGRILIVRSVCNGHIKRVARGEATTAHKFKFFLRFGNLFLSVVISEIRFCNTAETFL